MSKLEVWNRSVYGGRSSPLQDDAIAVHGWKLTLSRFLNSTYFNLYAEFYIDAANKTIAIKPVAERTGNSYLIDKSKRRFGLKHMLNTLKIKSDTYPAYWDDVQKWLVFTYETLDSPQP